MPINCGTRVLLRPDLVLVNDVGRPRLALEVKFGAALTRHQPVGYLQGLARDLPSALLFVVSTRQIASLTVKVLDRLARAGLLPAGDYGGLLVAAPAGGRAVVLNDGRWVAVVTEAAVLGALSRSGTPPDLLAPLQRQAEELSLRWDGDFVHVEQLLAAGMDARVVGDEHGVRTLCDWPYSAAQRMHLLYRPAWCPPGSRLPLFGIGLGWHWGSRLDGGTRGNNGTRPYVTVAVLDRRAPGLRTTLARAAPPGRPLEPAASSYPGWFYLPRLAPEYPAALSFEVRGALTAAWAAWSSGLDEAVGA